MNTPKKPSTKGQKRVSSQKDRAQHPQPTKATNVFLSHSSTDHATTGLELNMKPDIVTGGGKTNFLPALTRFKTPPNAETVKLQKDFADNLARAMQDKGMSQSDLARIVWGSTKDSRGYDVARNRDRISAYLAGAGIPEPDNLKKLAAALDLTPEDLLGAEVMAARPLTRTKSHQVDIQMASVIGRPGWMQVSLNVVVPMADAQEFLTLYDKVRQRQVDREEQEGNEE
jgi:transcriptional regulator with XRE-family HTH domain